MGYRHLLGDIGLEVAGGVPLPPFFPVFPLSFSLFFLFSDSPLADSNAYMQLSYCPIAVAQSGLHK